MEASRRGYVIAADRRRWPCDRQTLIFDFWAVVVVQVKPWWLLHGEVNGTGVVRLEGGVGLITWNACKMSTAAVSPSTVVD